MKWAFAATVALSIAPICLASYGAERSLTWRDVDYCRYDVKFDPLKYEKQRLKHTIDVIFTGYIFNFPSYLDYLNFGETGVEKYAEACERKLGELATFRVIDIRGIDDYKKLKEKQLRDQCEFGNIFIRGALGNVGALREYKPSSVHCSRFVDALEGKIDIKTVWRDVVNSSCETVYEPAACRASDFAHETKPDATEWIRRDVFNFGWNNCSTPYLQVNETRKKAEAIRAKLEAEFHARFKIKRHRCHT
jgi:hypothetical protein